MPLSASFRRELRNVTWFAALVARARGKCEICGGGHCLLEDAMQVCTLSEGALSDCYSVR